MPSSGMVTLLKFLTPLVFLANSHTSMLSSILYEIKICNFHAKMHILDWKKLIKEYRDIDGQ